MLPPSRLRASCRETRAVSTVTSVPWTGLPESSVTRPTIALLTPAALPDGLSWTCAPPARPRLPMMSTTMSDVREDSGARRTACARELIQSFYGQTSATAGDWRLHEQADRCVHDLVGVCSPCGPADRHGR